MKNDNQFKSQILGVDSLLCGFDNYLLLLGKSNPHVFLWIRDGSDNQYWYPRDLYFSRSLSGSLGRSGTQTLVPL